MEHKFISFAIGKTKLHVAVMSAALMCSGTTPAQTSTPKQGYIPDEKTAIAVGEAILSSIYGENVIHRERPFHGTLSGGIWTVSGTLVASNNLGMVKGGGTAEIRIDKQTGAVISYTHYK